MKKLILLSIFIPTLSYAASTDFIQKQLELSCIKGNAKRIKDESSCKIYLHKLESIPEPSCLNGRTTLAVHNIMSDANKNNCIIPAQSHILNPLQRSAETVCITNGILNIKQEPRCSIYKKQFTEIENPNCLNGKTTYTALQILAEARKNDCRADIENEKPNYTIEFSDGVPKGNELKKETEAYTNGIVRKMYKR